MFPYPSGSGLHVGHIRNYTIADALARFYRLKGYNVLMPIGWDAFGLPAEQYAIQTGNHPATFTQDNIKKFKEQLLKMGFSYDWSKEINTSEPAYYHIKSLQRNWIGLQKGTFIDFPVADKNLTIAVFTKSPQTLYGVSAIALSVKHPLITQITFPDKQTKINKFFANFVVSEYGTGAVMINAFAPEIFTYKEILNLVSEKELKQNQQIDYAFASRYDLPIKRIFQINNRNGKISGFFVNSPLINNLSDKEKAIEIINQYLEKEKKGQKGEPIPVIHWESGEKELIAEQELPLTLPPLADFRPSSQYYAPLQKATD
ncbi:25129_t:CDS:2 [Cetraspora pellucida]|uniref:leucine--tRNA ligase n=1 Tax=Cetraspora pellucida TaxID=1433469 RepID=A0A9N9A8A3_9GLOM|nr:25129_t:CDS:2 [Cetraspora pellucida]